MMGIAGAALIIGVPVLAFTLWPLLARGRARRTFLDLPPDARDQLLERKRTVLRALSELAFEHDAGHISDDDFADLQARYEAEAAAILTELDRLGPASAEPRPRAAPAAATARGWRHPLAVGGGAVALVVFGIALGAGIVRYTAPDPNAGAPMPGSRPLAPPIAAPPAIEPATPREGSGTRPITPEMLQGMLQAARSSLFAARYGEAIAAYQAVLKRDPANVDALTHLGLIVAIGGHADQALETIDRALTIDPNYPPALLYRGQILYEAKEDAAGAIRSWEKFLAVAPAGTERDRVSTMIAEAKARPARR